MAFFMKPILINIPNAIVASEAFCYSIPHVLLSHKIIQVTANIVNLKNQLTNKTKPNQKTT